ncbi:MAG TPA: serine/threonine-protein kinase [Gemmatimonadaceae bacterium]|nr:serine/threonine-protein kinase [Gemmatimonadaceae bacterium]
MIPDTPNAAERHDADRKAVERELGAQYQVVRSLGSGAAGVVYLARDRVLHRLVAIKVLRAELAGLEEERERFRDEARLSVRLSHPGLVPIYTVGETPSLVYTIMQYVDGGSLADQVRQNGRATVYETLRVLLELAEVLDYVHRQGVVHRDIKPENVLLAGTGPTARPVLGDFGVAAQPYRDRGVGHEPLVAGTAHYMSPEQLWGEYDVDRRSDIYSLGVLGYRLLAGVVPYAGPNAAAIAARRATAPHVPLRAAAPHVPAPLCAVVERCLEHDPNDRWRNARELSTALVRAGDRRPRWVRWMLRET